MTVTQSQFASFSPEMQTQLTAQGVQVIPDGMQPPAAPMGLMPAAAPSMTWAQPVAVPNISGWDSVSVPLAVDTAKGECTIHLNFNGVRTPDEVAALVKTLIDRGFPVKTWQKKSGGFSAK